MHQQREAAQTFGVSDDLCMESALPVPAVSRPCRREDAELSGTPAAERLDSLSGESAADVVSRARAGDPEAFRAIFQRYGKPILVFIFHLLGDRSRAEELTQEAFFRAFRGIDRFQEGSRLSTWLFGIARNVTWEAIRSRRRSLREVVLDNSVSHTLHDERANPGEDFLMAELELAIRRSLRGLSEDQRIVFVLKMLNRMQYRQISQITGSSIGKLKTDLRRARLQMRRKLQPYVASRVSGKRGEL